MVWLFERGQARRAAARAEATALVTALGREAIGVAKDRAIADQTRHNWRVVYLIERQLGLYQSQKDTATRYLDALA